MGRPDDRSGGGYDEKEKFRAEPAAMRKIAEEWRQLAVSSPTPQAYATTYVDFDPSGGAVMERFVDVTTGMDTGIANMMRDIVSCVEGSAAELTASANLYESLDADAAARLDKTYWKH